jgi:phosphoglycolate phosphatase-like HAD superfamily hydrolase
MQLVVFDVDGTLTDTTEVDAACFRQALADIVGRDINPGWAAYPSPTDAAITRHVYRTALGRDASAGELDTMRQRFLALLDAALTERPERCAPIPGAVTALARLAHDAQWRVAIATGCWRPSALRKLAHAGFAVATLPAAFAEDGPTRPQIIETAVVRARFQYGEAFSGVVCVGDAPWDVAAARELAYAFVGIGRDGRGERLRGAGAAQVVADYSDFDSFRHALTRARIPATVGGA